MKIRRLPETDLARIAPLPTDAKRRALRSLKAGWAPFSYEPVRKNTLCILNAQPPLVSVGETPWRAIEAEIRKACKTEEGTKANIEVAKLLYEEVRTSGYDAVQQEFGGFPLTVGERLNFWFNAVLLTPDSLIVAGCDFRRSGGAGHSVRRAAGSGRLAATQALVGQETLH